MKSNTDQLDLRARLERAERRPLRHVSGALPRGAGGGGSGPCGGWRDLIATHFPPEQVDRACRVMLCESGGNSAARNPRSSATGLFQILRGPTDPVANVRQAAAMWRARGWQPWVCKG